MSQPAAFPLGMAEDGVRVQVVSLVGGQGVIRRLTEMGINVGSDLTVKQHQGGGLVVQRGETRFALGGGLALKIMVARVHPEE